MVGDHKGTVPTNDYKGTVPTTELHVIHGDSPRLAVGFMLSDVSCAW